MKNTRGTHTTAFTLSITDNSCFFIDASDTLDCESIGVSSIQRRGGVLEYQLVSAPADTVLAFDEDHPSVQSARLVEKSDSGCLIELVVTGTCVAATLAEGHAIVTETTAESGAGVVSAEVTAETDVRTVVEHVREVHPGMKLVSKHEREGPMLAAFATRGLSDLLLATMTDRQRDAIQVAVESGYLAWPRRSTASECAEQLGVSYCRL